MGLLDEVKQAVIELNHLKEKGIIDDYAIGGGYGVIYHRVPISTFDLDIFAIVSSASELNILGEVYNYFREKGNTIKGEHIYIGDMAVQILPNISQLSNDAVKGADKADVDGVLTKVIRVEHLILLALDVFRDKDRIRVGQLLGKADKPLLEDFIKRYDNAEGTLRKRYEKVLGNS